MNDEYYLVENGEKTGPYTFNELINSDIDIYTELAKGQDEEPVYASELPEFNDYFEAQGIYLPTLDNLAPFIYRIIAFIVDYFLVSTVVGLIVVNMGWIILPTKPTLTLPYPASLILAAVFSIVFLLYNILFEISNLKGSPGKMIFKIMVVDVDGRNLTLGRSLVRNLGALISVMIYTLPFLTAFFNEHRQTWYERLTKSYQIIK